VVAFTCNPSFSEGRDKGLQFKVSTGEKNEQDPNLKNKPGMVVHTCNPDNLKGRVRGIMILGRPRQKGETLPEK
jgi:hypothetical protein